MTKNGKEKLGYNIKRLAKKRNMTIKELALRIGVNPVTAYRYVCGARTPSLTALGGLAIALGVNVADILDGIRTEEML